MKFTLNSEQIAILVVKAIILIASISLHFPILPFILLIGVDYLWEIIFNLLKSKGANTGNIQALERDFRYRTKLNTDYLYYNLYTFLSQLIPLAITIGASGSWSNKMQMGTIADLTKVATFMVPALLCFMVRLFDFLRYRKNKEFENKFIEELIHFNIVRMFCFCLLCLMSGPILVAFIGGDWLVPFLIYTLLLVGDSMLCIFFDIEKETVTF